MVSFIQQKIPGENSCSPIFKMFKKNKDSEDNETREERFKRIASRRVQDILDKLRLLGNCSEKANYSYTYKKYNKYSRKC